ncbi:hypothetical protein OAG21_01850 [Akkermansiaceae bacterium]|nr:hypothetical protein [Akkermansiaceae bacterium]
MSDFFENFSDGIEDNAGGLAAMGGLAALSNQRASLKKLSGIQEQLEKAQAASAKTEKERLAIEKKRLELQQAQIEEQKFTAESVKELRILMADADTLLERMSQMAAAPSGGGDTYDLDLTRTAALIQVKLELVEKNSEVLSDLADLKEQRRLKSHFEKQLSESATLRHLPENPLSFVEKEVFDQLPDIASVFGVLGELSSEQEPLSEGNRKLALGGASDGYMVSEEELLSRKQGLIEAIAKLQRIDQAKMQSGVAGKFTKDHFEEMKGLWGQFYFLKDKEPNYDFSVAIDYLQRLVDESQLKVETEGIGVDALAAIESHIACARDQGAMLADATHRISLGDFELARSAEQIPKAQRYENILFSFNKSKLVELEKHGDCFLPSIDFSAGDLDSASERIKRAWYELGVTNWPDDSELKQRISKNKKAVLGRISKGKRKSMICWGVILFIVLGAIIFQVSKVIQEDKRAAQEKEKVAQVAKAQMQAAEAKRRAAEAEIQAAEAKMQAANEAAREAEREVLKPGLVKFYSMPANSMCYEKSKIEELVDRGGKIVGWGGNYSSQHVKEIPDDISDFVAVSSGSNYTIGLRRNGQLIEWGNDKRSERSSSRLTSNGLGVSSGGRIFALDKDFQLRSWGSEYSYDVQLPINRAKYVSVASGERHAIALRKDGSIQTFGSLDGQQSIENEVVAVDAGGSHCLALTKNGKVFAWGGNSTGQCEVPADLNEVVAIAAGKSFNLALQRNGKVVAWGDNQIGQCNVPVITSDVVAISAGSEHGIALTKSGEVICWGSNYGGQCDVPDRLGDVVAIEGGETSTFVITMPRS